MNERQTSYPNHLLLKTESERRSVLKRKTSTRSGILSVVILGACLTLLLLQGPGIDASQKAEKKKIDHQNAYALYQKKCLSCHDSLANPDLPGRTRDDWFLVVNVMHGYGLNLTEQEAESITQLLFELRSGLEKEAG